MTEDREREEIGSLGEEAGRLLGSLASWAREHGSDLGHGLEDLAGQVSQSWHEVDGHLATGAAECTVCPLCRAVHAVRDLSPEVRSHLASASASILQAGLALLSSSAAGARHGERADPVERIDVDDNWPDE